MCICLTDRVTINTRCLSANWYTPEWALLLLLRVRFFFFYYLSASVIVLREIFMPMDDLALASIPYLWMRQYVDFCASCYCCAEYSFLPSTWLWLCIRFLFSVGSVVVIYAMISVVLVSLGWLVCCRSSISFTHTPCCLTYIPSPLTSLRKHFMTR